MKVPAVLLQDRFAAAGTLEHVGQDERGEQDDRAVVGLRTLTDEGATGPLRREAHRCTDQCRRQHAHQ